MRFCAVIWNFVLNYALGLVIKFVILEMLILVYCPLYPFYHHCLVAYLCCLTDSSREEKIQGLYADKGA